MTLGVTQLNLTCVITSDKVVQVMQYMASSLDDQSGDPSMVSIPPVKNYHTNTTLFVDQDDQFIDIIVSQRGEGRYAHQLYCFGKRLELLQCNKKHHF